MKILRLLNKKNFLSILFILCFGLHSFADDQPVDIWNVDKNKTENGKPQHQKGAPKRLGLPFIFR